MPAPAETDAPQQGHALLELIVALGLCSLSAAAAAELQGHSFRIFGVAAANAARAEETGILECHQAQTGWMRGWRCRSGSEERLTFITDTSPQTEL